MDPQRWKRVKNLLGDALELEPEHRARFLERSCVGDSRLRSEVEELLRAHDASDGVFDSETAPAAAESAPTFPSVVAHYRLEHKVGTGGMGVVYKARDLRLDRTVAVKFLSRDLLENREAKLRFQREARAASVLDHPNVCTIHDVDETNDGILFIVMAYYAGRTLKERLDEGPVGVAETLRIGTQVAHGLAAAHAEGVVHRDIKPSNIALAANGIVKILDFGVAILSDETRLTRSGSTLGTVAYMAPERFRDGPVDGRVDLWSLGVMLHEALVGDLPFSGQHYEALMHSILHEEPRRIALSDGRVEESLNAVLDKALQKDPERRYATAESIAEDLQGLVESVAADSLAPQPMAPKPRRPAVPRLHVAARMALGIATMIAVIYTMFVYVDRDRLDGSSASAAGPAPIAGAASSIAVLFFQNMTGNPALDWLRTGLAEMIVTDLAQAGGLEVTGTERVFQILRTLEMEDEPILSEAVIREVATRSRTDLVLVGSFLQVADKFRVTVHVVDGEDGSRRASRSFDADDEASLLPLVDEITAHLRLELDLSRFPEGEARVVAMTTAVPEAFREYSEGMLLHYMGRTPEAIPHLERSIELDPEFALALARLSVMHAIVDHDREALAFSSRALNNLDRLPMRERLYVEGNHYSWREATYGTAIDAYRRATGLYPDHWSAHHNLGVLYMELELYEQAIERFELVARAVPERLSNHWLMALGHAALGNVEDGASLLRDRIGPDPSGWNLLVDYQIRVGDAAGTREALVLATSPREGAPAEDHPWRLRILEGSWDEVDRRRAEPVETSDPYERAESFLQRGLYSQYLGYPAAAGELFERAASSYPEPGRASATARVLATQGFFEAGDLDRAMQQAGLAAAEGADDFGEWTGLSYQALVLGRRGDPDGARDIAEGLRARTSFVPGSKEERRYLWLLGRLAFLEGDLAAAIAHLESARELLPPRGIGWPDWMQPQHVPIYFALAEARASNGEHEEAAALFETIVSSTAERMMWPSAYADSLFWLGEFHRERGEMERAGNLLRRYLALRGRGTADRDRVRRAAAFVGALEPPAAHGFLDSVPSSPPAAEARR